MGTLIEYVPVKSAARMLRVTVQRVYQLMESGKLVGRKFDRTWLVSMRSIKLRFEEMEGRRNGRRSDR